MYKLLSIIKYVHTTYSVHSKLINVHPLHVSIQHKRFHTNLHKVNTSAHQHVFFVGVTFHLTGFQSTITITIQTINNALLNRKNYYNANSMIPLPGFSIIQLCILFLYSWYSSFRTFMTISCSIVYVMSHAILTGITSYKNLVSGAVPAAGQIVIQDASAQDSATEIVTAREQNAAHRAQGVNNDDAHTAARGVVINTGQAIARITALASGDASTSNLTSYTTRGDLNQFQDF